MLSILFTFALLIASVLLFHTASKYTELAYLLGAQVKQVKKKGVFMSSP